MDEDDMIRPLASTELPLLLPLARQFHSEGMFPGEFIDQSFLSSWGVFIESGSGTVLAHMTDGVPQGMIGGILFPDLYDGALVAVGAFWFVKENNRGQGLKLLYVFEAWAKSRGAKRILMSCQEKIMPEKFEAAYSRKGYVKLESHFWKEVR